MTIILKNNVDICFELGIKQQSLVFKSNVLLTHLSLECKHRLLHLLKMTGAIVLLVMTVALFAQKALAWLPGDKCHHSHGHKRSHGGENINTDCFKCLNK